MANIWGSQNPIPFVFTTGDTTDGGGDYPTDPTFNSVKIGDVTMGMSATEATFDIAGPSTGPIMSILPTAEMPAVIIPPGSHLVFQTAGTDAEVSKTYSFHTEGDNLYIHFDSLAALKIKPNGSAPADVYLYAKLWTVDGLVHQVPVDLHPTIEEARAAWKPEEHETVAFNDLCYMTTQGAVRMTEIETATEKPTDMVGPALYIYNTDIPKPAVMIETAEELPLVDPVDIIAADVPPDKIYYASDGTAGVWNPTSTFDVDDILYIIENNIFMAKYKIIATPDPTKIVLDRPSSAAWDEDKGSYVVTFSISEITKCQYVCSHLVIDALLDLSGTSSGQVNFEGLDHITYGLYGGTLIELDFNSHGDEALATQFWADHSAAILADNYILVPNA
jgi:hypothetical protein